MSVLIESGHINEYPYNHARILYGNVITAVTATGSRANYPASAALTDQTYERWSPSVSGDSITATFPAQNVNAIALAAHSNMTPTVEIRTSGGSFEEVFAYPFEGPSLSSDFASQDYGVLEYSPDNEALLFLIKPRFADAVRVTLTYTGDSPTLGVLRVGNVLEMQRPFYQGHNPAILAADTTLRPNVSESGEWLGASLIRQGRSLNFSWKNLKADWVRKNWVPFSQSMKTKPFIIAWNPKQFSADCFYSSTSTTPRPSNSGPLNYQSISLNARGYSDGTDPQVENIAAVDFEDLFTFSRSSTGTYYDISGTLQTAAIDEPRLTYAPDTNSAEGLLIEGASTNLLLRSEEFDDAAWTKANLTVTADSQTAPDGNMTADKLESNASGGSSFDQTISASGSTTYTISAYFKPAELSWVVLQFFDGISSVSFAYFDLSKGEIGTTSGLESAAIEEVSEGFYRCSVTNTTDSGSTTVRSRIFLAAADNDTNTGASAGGIYAWGAQADQNRYATSYIQTAGSQVTRASDNCVRTIGGEVAADEITICAEGFLSPSGKISYLFDTNSTGSSDRLVIFKDASDIINLFITPSTTLSTITVTQRKLFKCAISYSKSKQTLSGAVDGTYFSVSADTAINPSTLYLGSRFSGDDFLDDSLSFLEIRPRALSQSELEDLTA